MLCSIRLFLLLPISQQFFQKSFQFCTFHVGQTGEQFITIFPALMAIVEHMVSTLHEQTGQTVRRGLISKPSMWPMMRAMVFIMMWAMTVMMSVQTAAIALKIGLPTLTLFCALGTMVFTNRAASLILFHKYLLFLHI